MKYKGLFLGLLLILFACLPITTTAASVIDQTQLQHALHASIQYELPYPGILPNNILYPLKTLRDKIIGFLIADTVKKSQFNLLQADKRLAASEDMLAKGGEDTLVSETSSKAENYFAEAITSASQAKTEGRLVNDLLETLHTAGIKHEQVLYTMMQQSHGQLRGDLEQDIERVQQFENQVSQLKAKK